jgi:integrase/recombinase XerD
MRKTSDKSDSLPDDLGYWMSEWFKSKKRKSANTQAAYRLDVAQFLAYTKKAFNQVNIWDVLNYQSYLGSQCSERTMARKIAALRSFYLFLNKHQVVDINIALVESSSVKHEVNYDDLLTEKEIQAIINAASDRTHQVFVRLLYLTAARISEALSLRWRDLTPLDEGGEAHIMGKGKKRRNVFIPAVLWKDLQGIRGESADNDRLFPAIKDRFAALQVVKKLAKAAKIEKRVSPHSFRHAHISHALKNGATVAELRDQAGHANIATTSLYAHVSSERATATRLKVR